MVMKEDVVGLGSYGKTLTVLFTDEVIDEEDDETALDELDGIIVGFAETSPVSTKLPLHHILLKLVTSRVVSIPPQGILGGAKSAMGQYAGNDTELPKEILHQEVCDFSECFRSAYTDTHF